MKTSDILIAASQGIEFDANQAIKEFNLGYEMYWNYKERTFNISSEHCFSLAIRDALNIEANEGVYVPPSILEFDKCTNRTWYDFTDICSDCKHIIAHEGDYLE